VVAFNREHAEEELPWFGQDLLEKALATEGVASPAYLEAVDACTAAGLAELDRTLGEHDLDALLAPAIAPATPIDLVNGDTYTGGSSDSSALAGAPIWVTSLVGALIGALVGGGSLWLMGWIWEKLRGVEAMGLGDVKMMIAVGALLGWKLTLLSTFLGAFGGALIGVFLISKQKDRDMQTQIPFGIFLGSGSIIALLFGDRIIAWYLSTFVY